MSRYDKMSDGAILAAISTHKYNLKNLKPANSGQASNYYAPAIFYLEEELMKRHPTLECNRCSEISLKYIGTISEKGQPDLLEYSCPCGNYQTFPINSTYVPVHLRNQAE